MRRIIRISFLPIAYCYLLLLLFGREQNDEYHTVVVVAQQQQQQQRLTIQRQTLGNPYEGQFTGVDWADLNNDGVPDLLVSAGKHWIDQSYALINLGTTNSNSNGGSVIFSDPLPIGPPGGYTNVAVGNFASLSTGHHGVLLAGGDCHFFMPNQFGSCQPVITPARLLDVIVTGCSVQDPNTPCTMEWRQIWYDGSATRRGARGNRNGALSYELGNRGDPAIVLVGGTGATIFEPPFHHANIFDKGRHNGQQQSTPTYTDPTFTVSSEDMLYYSDRDPINRGTGLAVGMIGKSYPGFFVGTRTINMAPPAPLVGVWKTEKFLPEARYDWDIINVNNKYVVGPHQAEFAVQATNLVLADLDGDGIMDVVEANSISAPFVGTPVQQDYLLMDSEGYPKHGAPFSWEKGTGGRSIAAGELFLDSVGPDLALGTAEGEVVLFANLGHHDADTTTSTSSSSSTFRGFEERYRFQVVRGCEVRDVKIIPNLLINDNNSVSVVCVVYCDGGSDNTDNDTDESTLPPTSFSTSFSSSWPTEEEEVGRSDRRFDGGVFAFHIIQHSDDDGHTTTTTTADPMTKIPSDPPIAFAAVTATATATALSLPVTAPPDPPLSVAAVTATVPDPVATGAPITTPITKAAPVMASVNMITASTSQDNSNSSSTSNSIGKVWSNQAPSIITAAVFCIVLLLLL